MAGDSRRVHYIEGQRLSAGDLTAEQAYLAALDARHNAQQHAPGVVHGLRAGEDVTGSQVVAPGVAIDALGRELLSSGDVPVPGQPVDDIVDLWIVYCLVPLRPPQRGRYDCSPCAFPRWHEFGKVLVIPTTDGADVVPPVANAVYLGRVGRKTPLDISYTAVPAAVVADPGKRTSMQVGPPTGHDRNGFLVSATPSAGAATPRLAFDRLGVNTLWGTLNLLGYRASLSLPLPDGEFIANVKAKVPGTAGERIRARVESTTAGGDRVFTLTFTSFGAATVIESLKLPAKDPWDDLVQNFNKTSALVTVTIVPVPEPDADDDAGAGGGQDADAAGGGQAGPPTPGEDVPLRPDGVSLELGGWTSSPGQTPAPLRGCAPPPVPPGPDARQPNGISFTPPARPVKGTPLPGASVANVAGNGRNIQQMRLDLGAKKDNDPSIRLTIGGPIGAFNTFEWLTADGKGNVTLAGYKADPKNPPVSFNVTGTIEQSPIKPDPTDPDFANLLVAAWLRGLQSTVQATTIVQLTIPDLPQLVETDHAWQYTLSAANSDWSPVLADKVFETRVIGANTLLQNVGTQTTIPGHGTWTTTIPHTAGDMGNAEGNLSIEVRISGTIRNVHWWKAVTKGPIPLVKSPQLKTKIPTMAPANTAFEYSFDVTDVASRALHITSVTLTEGGAGRPANLAPLDLNTGDRATAGPFPVARINADLPIAIAITFDWQGGQHSDLNATHTIVMSGPELEITFALPATIGGRGVDWQYKINLKNVGIHEITVDSLEQSLTTTTGAALAAGPAIPLPLGGPVTLPPNVSQQVQVDPGTQVPVANADPKVRVNVQAHYHREGFAWTPPVHWEEIAVV